MPKLLFISFLFLFSNSYCQTIIKGSIISKNDNKLLYEVILFKRDSTQIQSEKFSSSNFEINTTKLENGSFIRIYSSGFKTIAKPLKTEDNPIFLDALELQEDINTLDEIIVVADKKAIQTNNGNLKFTINSTSLSNEGTSLDIIKKLPDVVVNDKKIEILGKGVPLIIIDGRESTLNDLDILPSSQILTIELIKNPGAEYSSSGNSVIKIITKTQKNKGFNLKLNAHISKGIFYRYYTGIDLGYKKKEASYYFHFDYNPYSIRNNDDYYRNFTLTNDKITNNVNQDFKNTSNFNFSFNTKQKISNKIDLIFQTNNQTNKKNISTLNYNLINQNNIDSEIFTQVNTPTYIINHNDNITLTGKINDKGHLFKILANYSFYKETNNQDIIETENSNTLNSQSNFKNTAKIFTLNPLLELPFEKQNITFKTGFKYSNLSSNNTYSYNKIIENLIKENILASYFQVEKTINKFNIQLGLRYEYAKSMGTQNNNNELFNRQYNNLLYNTNIQYTFDKNLKMFISYAYKINRPNLYDLTSYNTFIDRLTSFGGNPNLLPEYNKIFDFGITYKEVANLNFSYLNTENPIFYFVNYQGIKTTAIETNFDYSKKYTISFNIPYKYKFWTTYNSLGYLIQNNKFNTQNIDKNNTMFYFALFNEFKFNKTTTFNVLYKYNTDGLLGLLDYKSRNVFNVNLSKKVLKNKIELYVQWNDIFKNDIYNFYSSFNNLNIIDNKFLDNSRVRFGIIYKINEIDNKSNQKIDDTEINRIKK